MFIYKTNKADLCALGALARNEYLFQISFIGSQVASCGQ
jgi:hypothetical protein